METFKIIAFEMIYQQETIQLSFSTAELVRVTEHGDRLWYVDINGVDDQELLARFGRSEDIAIALTAVASSGQTFRGKGYFHPNEPHQAAAVRGDGELLEQ
ncbi:hypothetical protein BK133_09905 [Paenibacillus sp. FSL H8-0548]|uniref:hypothetical protein n=1 Tax=Paenibacillus sp. FSL H8-0548 TaxID=1920422 RepID=UPI00096DEC21|nr:hypothetical protein [Paenibacillus sp. FSL H8-0548]OMF35989.1 hypothetical protein BK133_09905 [Paenibacillus sp. FSL H8-0548]